MVHPKVSVRVDGGPEIGLGHLFRCIALGQMIKNDFPVRFFIKNDSKSIHDIFVEAGFEVFFIRNEEEFLSTLTGEEIVVLDGYHFDTLFQQQVKMFGCLLVCIDDLHDRHFVADILINHGPGVSKTSYSAEPYTRFLLGPEYALIRFSFLKQALNKRNPERIESVLICFGGSDFKNLTVPVLKIVLRNFYFKKITVVTGKAYSYEPELSAIITGNLDRITYLNGIDENRMIECMLSSQLAIVPASGILMETLATHCIAISGYYAENQKDLYHGFLDKKAIIGCDDFNQIALEGALMSVLETDEFNNVEIIDGQSGERIKKEFIDLYYKSSISVRLANDNDCLKYFGWVNEEAVRQNSRFQNGITMESHEAWFKKKINTDDSVLYIFQIKSTPVGQVRFERENDSWTIDYSVDLEFRGFGIGTFILERAIKELRRSSSMKIIAFVKENNKPSVRVFEKLNFEFDGTKEGYSYFSLK